MINLVSRWRPDPWSRPGPGKPHVVRVTLALSLALIFINIFVCYPLFRSEFTSSMAPAEGGWISVIRWAMNHPGDLTWLPVWFTGIPFYQIGFPGLLLTSAGFGHVMSWTPQHAYHFLTALFYCSGPLALFWCFYGATGQIDVGFSSGLLYSLFSPACLLIPAIRNGTGGLVGGRVFTLLVSGGQGPHVAAVAWIPIVLICIHYASTKRKFWAIAVTPFLFAGLILMDWSAALGFALAIGAYVLAFSGSQSKIHWPTLAGIMLIAYALAAPFVPLSTLKTITTNAVYSDALLLSHESLTGWIVLDAGGLALYFIFRWLRSDCWLRFFSYYAFFCAVVVTGRIWFGWHLLPQSNLLQAEFDLAFCGLLGYVLVRIIKRSPRSVQVVLLAFLLLFSLRQAAVLRKYAQSQSGSIDITEKVEYRMAKWYGTHMPGKRLFAADDMGLWINAFSDIPQVTGCCDGIVPNQEYRFAAWAVTTGQNAGFKDVEKSLLWLTAYGADAVATSSGFWNPNKFENTLPALWRQGTNVIYALKHHSASLAHVIAPEQFIRYFPESGLDTEVLNSYVGAIEAGDAPQADFVWLNAHQARIRADLRSGQLLSVQIGHDQGWHATVNGGSVPVFPDALGQLVIDPHCQGTCTISLNWGNGVTPAPATILQLGGLTLLLLWLLAAWLAALLPMQTTVKRWTHNMILTPYWAPFTISWFLALLLFRTAWIAEDAYISFRVLDNFLSGYGLRWNIDERVQVYTDPLFLGVILLFTWLFGHLYFVAIAVSLILTLGAFILITRNAAWPAIVTATAALFLSKAFIDFSVSGLENPATHLLIAAFLLVYWKRRDAFLLSFLAAITAINRLDTVLLFLPALCAVYFRTGPRVWKAALRGWSPLLAWSTFSLFYYGFLFPNTAFAKLNIGLSPKDVIWQGVGYYLALWRFDTASAFVILLGIAVACFAGEWALLAGIILNLLYILRVGGDYMIGRFFTAAVFLSAALLARYWKAQPVITVATCGLLLAAGFSIPTPTITSARSDFGAPWPVNAELGVADERAYWYPCSGLLRYFNRNQPVTISHLTRESNAYWMSCNAPGLYERKNSVWPEARVARTGNDLSVRSKNQREVFITHNIGMFGYFAGPHVHILDDMALGDALMARMPVVPGKWAAGNYLREIPSGYLETLRNGKNEIANQQTAGYYDHLKTVISGDLLSVHRLYEIICLNLGRYDHLLPHQNKPFSRSETHR